VTVATTVGDERRRTPDRRSFTGNPVWSRFTRGREVRGRPILRVDVVRIHRKLGVRSVARRRGSPAPSRFTGNTVCVSLTAHTHRLRNLTGNPVCPRGAVVQRYHPPTFGLCPSRRHGPLPSTPLSSTPSDGRPPLSTLADLHSRPGSTSTPDQGRPPPSTTTPDGRRIGTYFTGNAVCVPRPSIRDDRWPTSRLRPPVSRRRRARPPPTPSASFTGNTVSDSRGTRRPSAVGPRPRRVVISSVI
jgi:hypothetical protein